MTNNRIDLVCFYQSLVVLIEIGLCAVNNNRGISISVSKESDHRRLQQSNLTPIEQFFHSCLFPTAKMATGFYQEPSLLILNAEFERNG